MYKYNVIWILYVCDALVQVIDMVGKIFQINVVVVVLAAHSAKCCPLSFFFSRATFLKTVVPNCNSTG